MVRPLFLQQAGGGEEVVGAAVQPDRREGRRRPNVHHAERLREEAVARGDQQEQSVARAEQAAPHAARVHRVRYHVRLVQPPAET